MFPECWGGRVGKYQWVAVTAWRGVFCLHRACLQLLLGDFSFSHLILFLCGRVFCNSAAQRLQFVCSQMLWCRFYFANANRVKLHIHDSTQKQNAAVHKYLVILKNTISTCLFGHFPSLNALFVSFSIQVTWVRVIRLWTDRGAPGLHRLPPRAAQLRLRSIISHQVRADGFWDSGCWVHRQQLQLLLYSFNIFDP